MNKWYTFKCRIKQGMLTDESKRVKVLFKKEPFTLTPQCVKLKAKYGKNKKNTQQTDIKCFTFSASKRNQVEVL